MGKRILRPLPQSRSRLSGARNREEMKPGSAPLLFSFLEGEEGGENANGRVCWPVVLGGIADSKAFRAGGPEG